MAELSPATVNIAVLVVGAILYGLIWYGTRGLPRFAQMLARLAPLFLLVPVLLYVSMISAPRPPTMAHKPAPQPTLESAEARRMVEAEAQRRAAEEARREARGRSAKSARPRKPRRRSVCGGPEVRQAAGPATARGRQRCTAADCGSASTRSTSLSCAAAPAERRAAQRLGCRARLLRHGSRAQG